MEKNENTLISSKQKKAVSVVAETFISDAQRDQRAK